MENTLSLYLKFPISSQNNEPSARCSLLKKSQYPISNAELKEIPLPQREIFK